MDRGRSSQGIRRPHPAHQSLPSFCSINAAHAMKTSVLLFLLLAVTCSQNGLVQSLPFGDMATIAIEDCPLSVYGNLFTSVQIQTGQSAVTYCFINVASAPDCVSITTGNLPTSVETTVESAADPALGASVKAELPQLSDDLTCYLRTNLSSSSGTNMIVTWMKFGSQTALSVHLMMYLDPLVVRTCENVDATIGSQVVSSNFTKTEGENNKYIDMSGCRCNPMYRVCTVTAAQVIQFFGNVVSITDRCVHSLLQPVNNPGFELVATFKDRRSQIMPFLDSVDLLLPPNVIISLETSGRVWVDGQIQILTPEATLVHGVMLSRDSTGVTISISNPDISDDPVTVFFDGYSAHIKVPDGKSLAGLCGHAGDPTYPATSVPDIARSDEGCTTVPQSDDLVIGDTAATGRCSLLLSNPFTACHGKVPAEPHVQSCNTTMSNYPSVDNLLCQFFEAYDKTCELQHGIDLGDWRSSTGCPLEHHAYCQNHTCSTHEFCGESPLSGTGCLCRAIFASGYKAEDSLGEATMCQDNSASISLIGCLLEEKGIDFSSLHLLDNTCTGQLDSETHTLTFNFDTNNNCGSEINTNSSHVAYKNKIVVSGPQNGAIVTRQNLLEVDFSCVYTQPDVSTMSFNIRQSSSVHHVVSHTWNYTLFMNAYTDAARTNMLTPDMDVDLNQEVWIELTTEGLQGAAVQLVTDSCWVTSDPSPTAAMKYDLIVDGCPDLNDGTVEIKGNGMGKDNYFSFRMFQFVSSRDFFLHCQVNLCVDQDCSPDCSQPPARRRRALQESRSEKLRGDFISLGWSN
uniref:alpha-tectorin-like n=1 Tax=Doryrhamphus excisus TaxID=161450 RepID=UPI0025AE1CA8|nr:alpha-tectorin-like [Doryrhamphus excisus]